MSTSVWPNVIYDLNIKLSLNVQVINYCINLIICVLKWISCHSLEPFYVQVGFDFTLINRITDSCGADNECYFLLFFVKYAFKRSRLLFWVSNTRQFLQCGQNLIFEQSFFSIFLRYCFYVPHWNIWFYIFHVSYLMQF